MMTPIAARRIVLGLAMVAVGLAVIPRAPTVRLTLFVSPDAWELGESRVLTAPIRAFDEANVRLHDGGPVIRIEAHDIDSGRAEAFISDHPLSSPDVWIPASSIWSRLVGSKHPSLVDFD
ncbi:MAG TPA: hypothetical protein VFA25_02590, partial [Actinomycetota bacterium]|nr:hypothetical protein [Actinomycetota bacterium]